MAESEYRQKCPLTGVVSFTSPMTSRLPTFAHGCYSRIKKSSGWLMRAMNVLIAAMNRPYHFDWLQSNS